MKTITNISILLLSIFLICSISLYATDSELINYTSIRQVNGGRLTITDSIVIQINNAKGEYATNIYIPYAKNEKLSVGDAWIEDAMGNIIRKVKKSEFSDQSAISEGAMFEDRHAKTIELKHNKYPYRIIYSYQRSTTDFLMVGVWTPYMYRNQDVKYARLVVDIPALDYPIRYQCENIGEPQTETVDKRTIYRWETNYISQNEQTFSSASELGIPVVRILPIRFKYGVEGSWESWTSFGNWIGKLNENSTILPESEKKVVDNLLAGISEPKEKARILYHYLQKHTRYINVSLKVGGLKTYPAGYVVQNKYGDCKALSNYMVSLLEYAGIKAYYTLIASGSTIEPIRKDFPSQAFDHVIVTLPLEKDTIFLECTDKNIPFGYLGTFTQGRDALAISPDGSFFVRTPELKPADVLCTSKVQVSVGNNISNNKLKLELRGDAFEILNYYTASRTKTETEKVAREFIHSGNFDFKSLDIKKENPEEAKITLSAEIQSQNNYKKYGNNIALSPFPIEMSILESPKERTQSLQLDYPIAHADTLIYSLNDDLPSGKKPDNISIESPYGNYSVQFEMIENQLHVIKNLLIFRGVYPTEAYEPFYQFWSAIKLNESKNYYLETK